MPKRKSKNNLVMLSRNSFIKIFEAQGYTYFRQLTRKELEDHPEGSALLKSKINGTEDVIEYLLFKKDDLDVIAQYRLRIDESLK